MGKIFIYGVPDTPIKVEGTDVLSMIKFNGVHEVRRMADILMYSHDPGIIPVTLGDCSLAKVGILRTAENVYVAGAPIYDLCIGIDDTGWEMQNKFLVRRRNGKLIRDAIAKILKPYVSDVERVVFERQTIFQTDGILY